MGSSKLREIRVTSGQSNQTACGGCPAFRQRWGFYRRGFFIQVGKYLVNDRRIFNTGDDFDGATAFAARLNVDIEYALETLRPGHGCPAFGGCLVLRLIWRFELVAFAPLGRRHLRTMRAVGCEHPVIPGEIDPGLGHQSGQAGDEVRRFEDHISGAVAIGRFASLLGAIAIREYLVHYAGTDFHARMTIIRL